jgi:acetyl-CoA carboxylase biotin carboxyl carrier protein
MKTKIQQLIKIVEESNIDELEISTFWGGQKIRVTKNRTDSNVQPVMMPQPVIQQAPPISQPIVATSETAVPQQQIVDVPIPAPVVEEIAGEKFTAPLVGTYYQSSKPGTPPFVKEGDMITKGQIICIIEAMKIFNEIESEHTGVINKILVSDGTPVEYGQPLMIISQS